MPNYTAEPEQLPLTGDRVGRWLLGDVLGVGGMATVYSATGPKREVVAVKVLHPGKTDDEEARRFKREFLTLQSLRHPAIVSVYEAGLAGKFPWIAMELIPGTDLASMIQQWASHPPADRQALVESICRDICGALSHIHGAGLIHRDLKPSNILVTPDHRAKLTDFGVVKAPFGQFQTQLTAVGSLVGTAAFMSPEQISGTTVDGRSDLYSLGAVMYVMLTGARPITADTVAGYLARHLNEAPRDPRELNPHISKKLAHICLRLLEKDPDQRFTTADQLLRALDHHNAVELVETWGRTTELGQLLARITVSGAQRGGIVVVEGPAGSGRTNLLQKLAADAGASGHGVTLASAGNPDLLTHLSSGLPGSGEAEDELSPVDILAARTRGRPWTLIIDDFESIEPSTLKQLTALLRQHVHLENNPLLVIAATTHRAGAIGAFCSGVTTGLSTTSVVLTPLNASSIHGMLRDLGMTGPEAGTLAQRFVRADITWPGPIIERVEAMVRDGWFHREAPGRLRLVRDAAALERAPLPVPNQARNLLEQSLRALDRTQRTVLYTLAVLGGESDPATLRQITERAAAEVQQAIHALAAARFVTENTVGLHMLIQVHADHRASTLYELIPGNERVLLHRRVARALQTGRARAAEVAHHLVRGEQHAAALPLLLRAIDGHMRIHRNAEAQSELEQAERSLQLATAELSIPETHTFTRKLAERSAQLSERTGQETHALAAWERAHAAAESEADQAALRQARARIGILHARNDHTKAVRHLAPVWKTLSRGEPLWPEVTDALATGLLGVGRPRDSQKLFERLLKFGRDLGSAAIQADARYGLATLRLADDRPQDARDAFHAAETALRDAGRHERWGQAMVHLAELAYARGALLAATERAGEVARSPHVSDTVRIAARAILLHCADASGAPSTANPHGSLLVQELTTLQVGRNVGWMLRSSAARALLAIGQVEQAETILNPQLPDIWDDLDESLEPGLSDPAGQLFALRARIATDADLASADAWSALSRDLPQFPVPGARIAIDAAHGLVRCADPSAEDAVMEALDRTDQAELGLLRLEAAWLGHSLNLVTADDLQALTRQVARDSGEQPDLSRRWS